MTENAWFERRCPAEQGVGPAKGGSIRGRLRNFRVLLALVISGSLVLVPGCDDGNSTGPSGDSATYRVDIVSPHISDGSAALFELPSQGVETIKAIEGELHLREVDGRLRVLVLLPAPGGLALRLELERAEAPPEIELLQVANSANYLQDLEDYRLEVRRE